MLKISTSGTPGVGLNVPAGFIRRCYSWLILQISHTAFVDSQFTNLIIKKYMAIVNLMLMSLNDYVDFKCRSCLFEECMECSLCASCIDAMYEDYRYQMSINPVSDIR